VIDDERFDGGFLRFQPQAEPLKDHEKSRRGWEIEAFRTLA
jgi:hypothetical protein